MKILGQNRFQRLNLTLSQPWIAAEDYSGAGGLKRSRPLENPFSDVVPERPDLLWNANPDAEFLSRGKISGGKVGTIPQGLRRIENPFAGYGADARSIMQRAVDGADRNVQGLGNVADADGLFPGGQVCG